MVQSPSCASQVKRRSRFAGFTILEVTIALGLAGVLSTVVFPTVLNYRSQSDLNVAVSTVVQALGSARIFAQSNKHDASWGYNVPNGVLFRGTGYACGSRDTSSDILLKIPESVTSSGLPEVVFSQISGTAVKQGVILLTARSGLQAAVTIDGTTIQVVEVTPEILEAASQFNAAPSASCTTSSSSSSSISVSSSASSLAGSSASSVITSSPASSVTESVASSAVISSSPDAGTSSVASAPSSTPQNNGASSSDDTNTSVGIDSSTPASSESASAVSTGTSSDASSVTAQSSEDAQSSAISSSTPITPIIWQNQSIGVLILDPVAKGALSLTGNGSMMITNANATVVVDSTDPAAIWMSGNGKLSATSINIAGNPGIYKIWNTKVIGTVHAGVTPMTDPLADVPALAPPTQTFSAAKISGNTSITLNPGTYIGGIKVSANARVTLNPGIYYLQGGGFSLSGNATVTGRGVMIYNAPAQAADKITISGNANLTLSPLTSGTYAGISIYQSRSSDVTMTISGNGTLNMDGILYMANALLDIPGNGNVNLQCLASSRFIVKQLHFSGNGTFNVQ